MFENIVKFFKGLGKSENTNKSKDAAKERLHLVLMQDRANISADFLALMKQEIIEVIKKYIDVDESSIDVRLTNKDNGDGTKGAPALYANIPIINIKDEARQSNQNNTKENTNNIEKNEESKQEIQNTENESITENKENTENDVKNQEAEETVKEEKSEEVVTQNAEN